MYTTTNFKTKKALKEAVAAYNEWAKDPELWRKNNGEGSVAIRIKTPSPVTYYRPGYGDLPINGTITLEGPHYPEPHKWYANCVAKNGIIVSVK